MNSETLLILLTAAMFGSLAVVTGFIADAEGERRGRIECRLDRACADARAAGRSDPICEGRP